MPECQLISKVVYDPAQLKGGLEIVYKPSKKDGFAKFLTDPFAGYELIFKFISTYWIWKTKPYSCRGTGCTYMSGITQMVLPALFGFASAFNLHFLRSSLSFEPFISYFWKKLWICQKPIWVIVRCWGKSSMVCQQKSDAVLDALKCFSDSPNYS